MTRATDVTIDERPGADDVALNLLAAAIAASHHIDQLIHLAAHHRAGDTAALRDVADAIVIMNQVRARFIDDADRLITATGRLPSPQPPTR